MLWVGLFWVNVGLIAGGYFYAPDHLRPEVVISREASPAVGDSFVISFNQPVDRGSVLASLNIEPHVSVQTIWSEDGRSLRLIPMEGLIPDTNYMVSVDDVRPHLPIPVVAQASSVVKTDPVQGVVSVAKTAAVTPGGLPETEEVAHMIDGERVTAPIPRHREGTYIDIDLTKEILTIFSDGRVHKMYTISAQGPPAYPTPTGEFEIGYTNTNHFSSISHVWMPWSMQFFGDYFIHEVPYYPDGTILTSKYSGGCIRLDKGVAKEVYDIAEKGMKVVVYRS